jgi:hypothetical protein
LAPHLLQRTDRRSKSLEAAGPQRIISGTNATARRCKQRSRTTQHQGQSRRSYLVSVIKEGRRVRLLRSSDTPHTFAERLGVPSPAHDARLGREMSVAFELGLDGTEARIHVLHRIMLRSNSANAPVTWNSSQPIAVVVSMFCASR